MKSKTLGVILFFIGIVLVFWGVFGFEKKVVLVQGSSTKTDQGHWKQNEVVVTIDSSVDEIDPRAKEIIRAAFHEWYSSGANLPEIIFNEDSGLDVTFVPDGINAIVYKEINSKDHSNDLAITAGFSNDETGEIFEADIIINARFGYSILKPTLTQHSCTNEIKPSSCNNKYDLQSIMTHEAGHFLGLGENGKDNTAVMFSCNLPCETHKRTLNASDNARIIGAYSLVK